jgi:hypothetical protein
VGTLIASTLIASTLIVSTLIVDGNDHSHLNDMEI